MGADSPDSVQRWACTGFETPFCNGTVSFRSGDTRQRYVLSRDSERRSTGRRMVQFRARKSNEPFPRIKGDNHSAFDTVPNSDLSTAPLPSIRPRPATTRDLADEINGLA